MVMDVKIPPVSDDKEAFDFIIEHLKTQDQKSLNPQRGDGCQYRIDEYRDILKCAVGALISVREYAPFLEDQTIQFDGEVYDAVNNSNPDWRITENSVEMLTSMQRFHDELEVHAWYWMFSVIDQAIKEFGFENIVYNQGFERSALYAMVSMAQFKILEEDCRLQEWNFSEVTLDWFNDKREKAMAIA